jgi:hypothetical protein
MSASAETGESLDDLPLEAQLRRERLRASELDGRIEDLRATAIDRRTRRMSPTRDSAGGDVIVFEAFIGVADRAAADIPARAGAKREAVAA